MHEIKEVSSNEWVIWRDIRLAALRDAPYAYESKLSEWQGTGDTETRWRDRLDWAELNVLAYRDGEPIGMVSGKKGEDKAELISMWVAPSARGCGIGDALVGAVVNWARTNEYRIVELEVAEGNERAANLYQRHGFRYVVGEVEGCGSFMRLQL